MSYNGQSFTSPLGNHWDNYTGTDADGDGVGDMPYAISASAEDLYPLMGAWQNDTIASPAGSTAITITSPWDDTVAAGDNVTVAGNVADTAITSLTLTHNNISSTVPVEDRNFSAVVNLTAANTIVVSGVDSQGIPLSATLLLDGDMLPAAYEQAIGFDPLDADSDCSQWPGNQAGNGIIDGYEIFAGDLPVFAKYRIGADPFVVDTDADGLTDGAEVALGTNATCPYSGGDGIPDGAKDYWSSERFLDDTLNLTVFGRGYAGANVSVAEVNYTHLIDEEILVSKVCDIGFGDDVESGTIEIAYNPTYVENASRLSIYRFDEDLGTFVNVSSTVDSASRIVSCAAAGSAKYAVLDSARWDALFEDEATTELLGETDTYHALLWVKDSQTGEGVGNADVTFWGVMGSQDLTTTTHATGDRKGLTRNYAEYPMSGAKAYSIEKDGYKDHNGVFRIDEGDYNFTATSLIHQVDAPTGNLTVTSTPSVGVVVSIDNIYYGSGVSNVELLEGEHTLVLTTPSSYYGTAIETVEITRNQHTSKHINLPLASSCGDVRVICSESGAAVFIDGFGVGVIPASGVLTRADVPSGARNVAVTKEGFAPYSEYVTVVSGQTSTVNVVLVPEDLDGDGLPDIKETGGYRDGYGRWHYSDPNAVDTDGDELSDSYEAGFYFTVDGKTYHKSRSDSTKVDTDGDGLDDFWEDYWGTDSYNTDTDGDGLPDGEDDQPLVPANPIGDLIVERLRQEVALRLGATFGEAGLAGEDWNRLVGDWASHPYYALGWVASGIAMYGDVRDLLYAISQADTVGAAINGLGLAPYIGDSCKTAADVAKYLVKYPDNLLEIGRLLADQRVIQLLPDKDQLNVIDHFYLSATGRRVGTELATEYGLTGALVAKIQGRGIKLDEVVLVVKAGDDAVPFTSGKFTHAVGRHVDGTEGVGNPTTLFPTSEQVTSFGIPYPGTSSLTREQMKEKILDWVAEALPLKLTEWPMQKTPVKFKFPEGERSGVRVIEIGVDKSGVYTVFPLEGEQVYKWIPYSGQWEHMPYTGKYD